MADDLIERLETTRLFYGYGDESDLPELAATALKRLRAQLAEQAAQIAEMREALEWQPIKTAPKTEPILIWPSAHGNVHIATWSPRRKQAGFWNVSHMPLNACVALQPTHWAPLRPPHAALAPSSDSSTETGSDAEV